jgi:hypothetical protein
MVAVPIVAGVVRLRLRLLEVVVRIDLSSLVNVRKSLE